MLGAALALGAMALFAVCAIITASAMRRRDTDAGALIAALVNLPLGIVLVLAQLVLFGALQPPSLPGVLGCMGSRRSAGGAAAQTPGVDMRGVLLVGLGSSTAYAVSHILRAAAMASWNEPVAGVALGAAAGSTALVLAHARKLARLRARIAAEPGAAALYAGVGCMQLMGQALMIASLAHIPASIAALITMCTPLIVLPASLLLFRNREGIGPAVVLGMLITIGGVALTTLQLH